MCWIPYNISEVSCLKADTDIVVYKLVTQATKDFCMSSVKNYKYNTTVQPIIELIPLSFTGCITKGYHSYMNVKYVKNKENSIILLTVGLFHFPMTHQLKGNYLAKFIIPKGSLYCKNIFDEVVSNSIKYTGEYTLIQS